MELGNEMEKELKQEVEPQEKKTKKTGYVLAALFGAALMLLICSILFRVVIQKISVGELQLKGNADGENSTAADVVSDNSVQGKLLTLARMLDSGYYEDIDTEQLEEYLYKGLVVGTGDMYSSYYTEEEMTAVTESITGVYYGIGVTMSLNEESGLAEIIKVAKNSPAEEAGVKIGDIIYAVNGESVADWDMTSIAAKVKGEEGTTVDITFLRNGEEITLTMARADIETETVTYEMLEGNIGYILLSGFEEVTVNQFADAYNDLKNRGMEGLIVDLRDNPGGSVTSANGIAEYLIPEGLLTYMEDKYGDRTEFSCTGQLTWGGPLVILVNGNSASASEMVAGAVRDYKTGTIMGTTTYGKGVAQTTTTLSDGSALKFTFAKYFTPKGECIHKIGVKPDIEVELDEIIYEQGYSKENDNQLRAAIEELKNQLK